MCTVTRNFQVLLIHGGQGSPLAKQSHRNTRQAARDGGERRRIWTCRPLQYHGLIVLMLISFGDLLQ